MLKLLLRFSFILLLFPYAGHSQSCASTSRNPWEWPSHNNWYIGTFPATWTEQAHIINFSAGFAVTTRGNGTVANAMYSYEGITSASDDKGNLIVFSNGIKAWNNAGTQTSSTIGEGSEGIGTVGSASQGIISVRHPLDPNKYYFIATADIIGPSILTTYNVFDQTGTQVQVNTNMPGNIVATEGIAATMHQNGVDIWIVVAQKSSTNLQAWLLTCEGFVNPPVTSAVGVSFSGDAARGGIALSHDGKKFASVHGGSGTQQVSLYDFNNGTGVISNRQDIGPCCSFARGYDVVFSKDNSGLVVGSWGVQGAFYFDIASKSVSTITGPDALHHAVEIGGDGNYYFKGKDGLWRWTGSGAATKVAGAVGNTTGQGLPSMYMPPLEEPDIKEVGPFCTTDPAIDLKTTWICTGINAEDTLNWVAPSAQYSGTGITNTTRGIFNPNTAGPGLHQIIFKKCAVDDTIFIRVNQCSSCNVNLKNTTPEICIGQSVKLDSLILANNGTGVWSIDSVPTSTGSNATLSISGTDTLFNALAANTKPGKYKLKLTNTFSGTTCKDSIYIIVNAYPVVTVRDTAICSGDAAVSFTAVSATATTYAWSATGTGTAQSTSGKTAGNYTVVVTDAKGCKDTATAVLTVNTKPNITLRDTAICSGDAAITFTPGAGFTAYQWSGGSTATSASISASTAGNYTVAVTDAKGCKDTATAVLTVNARPNITLRDTAICNGDAAINFTPGVGYSSYKWSGGSTATSASIAASTAGNYTVAVTDSKGCKDTATAVLTVNTRPTIAMRDTAICSGDAAITFTPGATFASYKWSGGSTATTASVSASTAGNYTVVVTDAKGCKDTATAVLTVNTKPNITLRDTAICNGDAAISFTPGAGYTAYKWSGGSTATSASISAATAGNYTVAVTDAKGCKDTATAVLTVNARPNITLRDTAICNGDAAISFTPGAGYTAYKWSGGSTATTASISTNTAGTYTVAVTDAKGCKDTASAVLKLNANPTPLIQDATICPGMSQTIDATYNGTVGPYQYSWNTGATTASIQVTPAAKTTYTVTVTDANKCKGSDQAIIDINNNLTVQFPAAIVNLCAGESTTLKSNYSAADGYNFTWTPGGETTESITVSTSGTYDLHVDNGVGCEGDGSVQVIVNPKPVVGNAPASVCDGENAVIGEDAGTGMTYKWSGREDISYSISVSEPGNYKRIVTTSAGCKDSSVYVVTVNSNPTVNLTDANVCEGVNVTLSDPNLSNGYSYSWSSGENTASISPTVSGTYTLTATNIATTCVGSGEATVNFVPIPTVDLGPDTIPICEGEQAMADAKNEGLSILWSNGSTTSQITINTTGLYSVTVSNGTCSATDQVYVDVQAMPVSLLNKALEDELFCFEKLPNGVPLSAGTSNSYSYLWSTGERTSDITALTEGTYSVNISIGNCSIDDEITLTDFCPHAIYVPNAITPNGDGINDVFYAYGHHIIDFEMFIFDRWGLQIAKVDDMSKGWDGTYAGNPVQMDVFIWKMWYTYETEDGATKEETAVGTVSVLK